MNNTQNYFGWKYYKDKRTNENMGIVSPDGRQSILLIDPQVIAWLAEGNEPTPADE
jgi:hypothetical protein